MPAHAGQFFLLRRPPAQLIEIAEKYLHRVCTCRPRAVSLYGALSEESHTEKLGRDIVGCAWEATTRKVASQLLEHYVTFVDLMSLQKSRTALSKQCTTFIQSNSYPTGIEWHCLSIPMKSSELGPELIWQATCF